MIHLKNIDGGIANTPARLRYSIKSMLLTIAVLAIALTLLLKFIQFNRNADIRRIFGGSAGLDILRHADRVEAYRIGPAPERMQMESNAGLADHPILTDPLVVPVSNAKQLSSILSDRNSYNWFSAKACIPRPGVRLDFIRGGNRLSVLLCFECDILQTFLDGKPVGGEDFDNIRKGLVRIVRPLFPDDKVVQAIPETHWE